MWEKRGLIYNVNGQYDWNKSHAHVVCADVIAEKNIISLIFSTRNSKNQCLPTFVNVSIDEIKVVKDIEAYPIMQLGERGAFDDCGVMPTWLYREGDKRLLYYIGWTVRNTIPYHNSLGVAVSYDGVKYERLYKGPVMTITHEEPFFVASACIIKEHDIWRAWYLSCIGWEVVEDKPEPLYDIKYASSSDGIQWTRTGQVCIALKKEEGGISRPTVIKENGIYKMWYSYRGRKNFKQFSDQSYRIGYAESIDGIVWKRMDEASGIDVSAGGWDSEMIEYPLVTIINDKKTMFYNGNGFGKTGFGYAVWKD